MSFSHRKPPQHIHGPGLHICGPELIVEVRKEMARLTGYDGYALLVWKNTREVEFSSRRVFSTATAFLGHSWRNICGYDSIDLAMDCDLRELFPSTGLCFRFFFCMTEGAFAFDSSCPTIWRAPFSVASRLGGWLPLHSPLYIPQIQAYLLHLTTRLCSMIASWNGLIFRRLGIGGVIKCNHLGKWGTVKRFLFFAFS